LGPVENVFESGRQALAHIVAKRLPVTALFAYNDEMAAGVIYEAAKRKIQVPLALSVLGIDDLRLANMTCPKITTIAQPQYEQGAAAAAVLLEMLDGKEGADRLLEPSLVERESCAELGAEKSGQENGTIING
jgi:DNA-binding LacI/PurR family transcriptional regulator